MTRRCRERQEESIEGLPLPDLPNGAEHAAAVDGLQPKSDGLQPSSDGLHPTSDGYTKKSQLFLADAPPPLPADEPPPEECCIA